MTIFGYRFVNEKELQKNEELVAVLKKDFNTFQKLANEYRDQVKKLRQFQQENRFKDVMPIDIGDPTPDNPDARKMYIGRVAGFYRDILQKKCTQMISVSHRLLEEETNDHETDLYLKMCVFICRDFMKWGEQAVAEQISYQTEPPPSPAEQKEELITQIKL